MRSQFSEDDWMQLVFFPLDIFMFVAGIDDEIDDAESRAFKNQLVDASMLKNPLHRAVMEDLASVFHAIAAGREEGVAPGSPILVSGVGPAGSGRVVMPEDRGDEVLAAFAEAADRTRQGSVQPPTGGAGVAQRILMPTGEMASSPPSFYVVKELLKRSLNDDEYEYFMASVLFSAIEIAKASGGAGAESISMEENVALQVLCTTVEVGPEAIPRHFAGPRS